MLTFERRERRGSRRNAGEMNRHRCENYYCSTSRQPSFCTQRSVALSIISWLPCCNLGSRATSLWQLLSWVMYSEDGLLGWTHSDEQAERVSTAIARKRNECMNPSC